MYSAHIRENALRMQQNLLMEKLGDDRAALWEACLTAAYYHEHTSAGITREGLFKPPPPALPPKPKVPAVLIEGEG